MGRAETIEAILSFCKVRLVLSDMIIVVTLMAGGFWKFELCWILWWTVAKLLVRSSSFLEKKLTCARDRHTLHYKVVWISQKSKCTSRVTLPQTLDFVGFFWLFPHITGVVNKQCNNNFRLCLCHVTSFQMGMPQHVHFAKKPLPSCSCLFTA